MAGLKNFSINKRGRGLLKILALIVVSAFLLFALNLFVLPIKNCFYILSSPIQKIFWHAGESCASSFGSLWRAGLLSKENENLKSENQKLFSQVAVLQSIAEANKAQSDVSVSCQNAGFKFVMAGVMGLDADDILSINKGLSDGIAEGMPVIDQNNVLFGKVYNVYKNFSQIILVSSKNSVVNVKVQQNPWRISLAGPEGYPEIDGVVKGSGGLSAYLDLIPVSSDIIAQDVLVTSSMEKFFPKDLLVGKIVEIQKDDQKPFQQARVRLFLDIKTADNLFVITNYKR